MRVLIPGALHSYTGAARVDASGATLADVLDDLERQFPGIRFRMVDEQQRLRPHVRFFHAGQQMRELHEHVRADEELIIVQALSGG